MTDIVERLRYGASCSISGPSDEMANDMKEAADEIERLRTENAKLRAERVDARRLLEQSQAAEMRMFDRAEKAEQERDALAAILSDIAEVMNDANQDIAQIDELLEQEDYAAILAARDARVKSDERERCAKVCELYDSDDNAVDGRHVLAAAIRAMKD